MVSRKKTFFSWIKDNTFLFPFIKKRINWILGITYILVLLTGFIIESVFPFEITQEVFIVNNQTNYFIYEITQTIVGLTVFIMLSHLCLKIGYDIGVAKTEESFKKNQSRKES